MDSVVFYDGYAGLVDEPTPEGVHRLDNSLFTTRLSEEQLSSIQGHLKLQVTIGALCDNYDRIGNVRLAFVPKGSESYEANDVERIELARFITPFMDMNRTPDTVDYKWDLDHIAPILTDIELQKSYDFWLEFHVFGVPYAANDEVPGCAERSDVFRGWLSLYTDSTATAQEFDHLIPLAFNAPFNNYQSGASDAMGTTQKTFEFSLEEDKGETQLVLITSNHGANSGGEEYERRDHFVTFDGASVLQYKPGRNSCEPFRIVNTQSNGIYGPSPRSDQEWQSFSNWCPGDIIDVRLIPLGAVSAGPHEVVLEVPDAVFADGQGNIPVSLYVQAR
jgi:hypothetical protein